MIYQTYSNVLVFINQRVNIKSVPSPATNSWVIEPDVPLVVFLVCLEHCLFQHIPLERKKP